MDPSPSAPRRYRRRPDGARRRCGCGCAERKLSLQSRSSHARHAADPLQAAGRAVCRFVVSCPRRRRPPTGAPTGSMRRIRRSAGHHKRPRLPRRGSHAPSGVSARERGASPGQSPHHPDNRRITPDNRRTHVGARATAACSPDSMSLHADLAARDLVLAEDEDPARPGPVRPLHLRAQRACVVVDERGHAGVTQVAGPARGRPAAPPRPAPPRRRPAPTRRALPASPAPGVPCRPRTLCRPGPAPRAARTSPS